MRLKGLSEVSGERPIRYQRVCQRPRPNNSSWRVAPRFQSHPFILQMGKMGPPIKGDLLRKTQCTRGVLSSELLVVYPCAAQYRCRSKTEAGGVRCPDHSQGLKGRRTVVGSTFQMGTLRYTLTPPPHQVAPSGSGGTTQLGTEIPHALRVRRSQWVSHGVRRVLLTTSRTGPSTGAGSYLVSLASRRSVAMATTGLTFQGPVAGGWLTLANDVLCFSNVKSCWPIVRAVSKSAEKLPEF